jgi:1-acyl-sn-glycerol-3-phosphate acyltransferase
MISLLRLGAGLVCVGALVLLMIPVLLLFLPSRVLRIRVANAFGSAIGRSALWCSGSRVAVSGREHVRVDRPAIYACNHTSILDAFTTIWLTPMGTVGVAKREVFFYPFYGQAWWLAGHVFLDRARSERAKASLRRTAEFIRRKRLNLCMLPEGTRSDSGRLLPFKKGIIHLALATRLPIVPMVTMGLQHAWKRKTLHLTPADARIVFLPPIATDDWSEDRIDEHLAELRAAFVAALPESQQPG